jgi:tetratricopeptide (TPR) repeat protein
VRQDYLQDDPLMPRQRTSRSRPRPAPGATTWPWIPWHAIALAAVTLIVYANALSGPFVRDDVVAIVENTSIRSLADLAGIFTPERELPVAGRPLVNLSLALNYAAGGLSVRGYHAVNLGIHVVCGLLLFGLVRRIVKLVAARGAPQGTLPDLTWLAFAVALLWLVHPLNTEAVDYLTQRSELMMGACYLLTLYAGVRAVDSGKPRVWTAIAVGACAAGMACKESMVTAPVMAVLLDGLVVFGSAREAMRRRWPLYVALCSTWFVLIALNWSGPRVHSAGFSSGVAPWTYLLNQAGMIVQYVKLAIWPASLVGEYGWPRPLTLGVVWPQAALVTLLLLATLIALARWPVIGFLGAWFFVTLAPTSSIVPIATEAGAERRMYLPLIACVVLSVLGVWFVLRRVGRRADRVDAQRAAAALLAVVAVAYGWRTWSRNQDYRSSVALARVAVDRYPNGVARLQLGMALAADGRRAEGIEQMRLAASDNPRAHYALGVELFNDGRLDEAIDELSAFVRDEPLLEEVVAARQALGRAFALQRRWPEAVEQYRLALGLNPTPAEAADTSGYLGDAFYEQQAFADSIPWFRRYLQAHPDDTAVLTRLGLALISTGRLDEALAAFRRAAEIAPGDATAQRNLATALYDHHDLDEAIIHARKALAMRPDDAAMHQLLGRALAIRGDLERAAAELEQARRLDAQNAEIAEDLRRVNQLRRAK